MRHPGCFLLEIGKGVGFPPGKHVEEPAHRSTCQDAACDDDPQLRQRRPQPAGEETTAAAGAVRRQGRAVPRTVVPVPERHDIRPIVREEAQRLVGDGANLTLEATGVPQVLEQTLPLTRPRGKVVLAGNQPLDKSLPLTFIENMMRREISLIGCFMSYSAPFPGHEWTETITALQNGSLDMETLISHRYPLSKAPEIFEQIGAHQLAHQKIMMNPEEVA